jgi:hypothetical protein
MLNFIKNFAAKDDGAVTVDWVVLTAAVIGLGFGVFSLVQSGADDLATGIETELTAATTGDANS